MDLPQKIAVIADTRVTDLMNILTLNCQKGFQPALPSFLNRTLDAGTYDFLLLQEATDTVLAAISPEAEYAVLRAYNADAGAMSHLAIAYRKSFTLLEEKLHSFTAFHPTITERPEFGILLGTFDTGIERITFGSIHLHPGLDAGVRMAEAKAAKEHLAQQTGPVLFAGDFNTGFPFEPYRIERILTPAYTRISKTIGPTLDSRYAEPANNIVNMTAVRLAKLGLGISLKADHVYGNKSLLETYSASCRILSERVSDHRPVETRLIRTEKSLPAEALRL
jgi:endonuclease/exonuclease/phosphatase family metal-dependent hydrolase